MRGYDNPKLIEFYLRKPKNLCVRIMPVNELKFRTSVACKQTIYNDLPAIKQDGHFGVDSHGKEPT